ncbi:MAG: HPr family phosphocarrier protein [Candidatus Aureabacteria bacterium]|nr:HPr family phosphocarrier protein [Candidatus Auribacterota bacterium]
MSTEDATNTFERRVAILNKLGLHARPAAMLVKNANRFKSDIFITKEDANGETVNGKSIMGVMMLAASIGTSLTIKAVGHDCKEAVETLEALINDKFGEE